MTLREQLARHMASALDPDGGDPVKMWEMYPDTITTRESRGFWLSVADECIRQMEWARSRKFVCGGMLQDGDWGTPWHMKKMTAAPDGWRPNVPNVR